MVKKLFIPIFLVSFSCAVGSYLKYLTYLLGCESLESAIKNDRPTLTERDYDGNVLIQRLILEEDPENALLLAQHKKGISNVNPKGETALIMAAKKGYFELVEELLKKEDKINQANCEGNTAIHMAAMNNHVEIVNLLASKGCEVNTFNNEKLSPVHLAAMGGHVETIDALMEIRADINSNGNHTALIWSVIKGHVQVSKRLLEFNEINLNAEGYEFSEYRDMNALQIAAYILKEDLVKLLLTKKDKIKVDHSHKWSVFYMLVSGPDQRECLSDNERKYWTKPPNNNLSDEEKLKLKRIVDLLLNAGGNPAIQNDRTGFNVLQYAIRVGDEAMFSIIFEKIEEELASGKRDRWTSLAHSKSNFVDKTETPLHIAIRFNRRNMISSLMHAQTNDVEFSVREAKDAMKVFDCNVVSIKILILRAKYSVVKDFKAFWSFILEEFTKGIKPNLESYKKENVHLLYCAAKGIYPEYVKHLKNSSESELTRKQLLGLIKHSKDDIKNFEEEEILIEKQKIEEAFLKLGRNVSYEDSLLLTIIQMRSGRDWKNAI